MVSNNVAKRVDFLAPGVGVFAVRFHTQQGFADFLSRYKDALFENTHKCRATEENREKVYGVSFTAWAAGEDHPEAVWDVSDEPRPELPAAPQRMTTRWTPTRRCTPRTARTRWT